MALTRIHSYMATAREYRHACVTVWLHHETDPTFIIIIITSNDDIQPSTVVSN